MNRHATDISTQIWEMKYRYKNAHTVIDRTVDDTWRRVARAVAEAESESEKFEGIFYRLLKDYRFLPGGRILANAGTDRESVTMFNCYVMNRVPDSLTGIFDVVKESALTQKEGGGVGFDFSTIRPKGDHVRGVDAMASGPVSFMHVLDATCKTIMSAGQRRGAQMSMLRCDHPDIREFITAKHQDGALTNFNTSVAVTAPFMKAVDEDRDWPLQFDGRIYGTDKARELWDLIMDSTYNHAEPGVVFIDRINEMNNLAYTETIAATNPCGEQPLPPYGACLLGSINLTRFVDKPFSDERRIDLEGIAETTQIAVRFLDNVIELSHYPLNQQANEAVAKRRMGIGITGLANLLAFMKLRYNSPEAINVAQDIMRLICHTAYRASAELAREKGSFPLFDNEAYLSGKFIQSLPDDIQQAIRRYGIRNSHLISIAPTGTISLFAGNVSSGLEPVYAYRYTRKIRQGDGDKTHDSEVMDYAYQQYISLFGEPTSVPDYFMTTADISPNEHIDIQAALQPFVDSSISKTVNVPADISYDEFKDVYCYAYSKGLKGCTTFRPSPHISGVLVDSNEQGKSHETERGTIKIPGVMAARPHILDGSTYKIKIPLSADAFYVTINDIVESAQPRPYELFINTKNLQHAGWIVTMTRLISAVFRREKNPTFLVDELKSIYDPNGGYFSNGRYIPSLAAEIGLVIEEHLINIGLLARPENKMNSKHGASKTDANGKYNDNDIGEFSFCPHCNERSLVCQENCWKCMNCTYNQCG